MSRSPDVSETEKRELSSAPTDDNYGSTPVKDKSVSGFYVPFCGVVFYIMDFMGFFCCGLLREGLNVAIVAMVNQTTVTEAQTTNVSGQCPKEPEVEKRAGEFNWDRNQQGVLLAAFYYGFIVTQIPGGWLADRFGGKWLFGGGILLSSVVSLVTPAAARIHIGFVIALRVLSGLGEGFIPPATESMIARWTVPRHYSVVSGTLLVGTDTGVIVGLFLAGILCDYGFAGGWPSVFYVFGMVGCVWFVSWCFLCYSSPYTHPRISRAELKYFETMIGAKDLARHPPTPWKAILTSVPVWALTGVFLAENWLFYGLMTCLPLYMHDVLGLNLTNIGVSSSFPFLGTIISAPITGLVVDYLRAPGRLSTGVVRKVSVFAGCVLCDICLITIWFVGCNHALTVLNFFLLLVCDGMVINCVTSNQLDLAPLHAGKLMGLTCSLGTLGGILQPLFVGAMTAQQSTRLTWQNVFFVTAGVNTFGALVFVIFGSGNRQSWAE